MPVYLKRGKRGAKAVAGLLAGVALAAFLVYVAPAWLAITVIVALVAVRPIAYAIRQRRIRGRD